MILSVWAGVAAFFAAGNVANQVMRGRAIEWLDAVGIEFVYWIPWVAMTPLLLWLVRRYRLDRGWSERGALAAAGVPISVVQAVAAVLLIYATYALAGSAEDLARLRPQIGLGIATYTITAYWKYWGVIAVMAALVYGRELTRREVESARLETRLANARLHALRMRLQPHFLFNTLHSVSMLNLRDVDAANRLLVKLSDLLRATLSTAEQAVVPLEREIALVDRYVEIESIRIGERLDVEWDVDEEVLDAEVPTLVLQPLVENAVRHGIAPDSTAGRLSIRAFRERDDLFLEVVDDGPGFPDGFDLDRDAGVGLGTTKARIERLYEGAGEVAVDSAPEGGARVWVRLPFRRVEAEALRAPRERGER
ncbi:MAG: histidine kinase [Gemmatimonadota bacterium]|nr:histidine kinase [Gemmatimonadota bacterium]